MVFEIEKARIERGIQCRACKASIPPTTDYRVTCPKCRQLHVAPVSK